MGACCIVVTASTHSFGIPSATTSPVFNSEGKQKLCDAVGLNADWEIPLTNEYVFINSAQAPLETVLCMCHTMRFHHSGLCRRFFIHFLSPCSNKDSLSLYK